MIAGLLVAVGATSIGAHLVSRLSPDFAHLVSLAGGLTVIVGLILGFGAMAMLLFENVYLLIRQEGLLCHENGKEIAIAWSELERVSLEAKTGVLVFERSGRAPVKWFAGKPAKDIQTRVEEAKRKALHGLLAPDT